MARSRGTSRKSELKGRKVTPQEAKRLSLENDCRNTYGENDKGSRKAIPAFKARSNRSARRDVKQKVESVAGKEISDRDESRIAKASFKGLHPKKTKGSDQPLWADLTARGRIHTDFRPRKKEGGPNTKVWVRNRTGREG